MSWWTRLFKKTHCTQPAPPPVIEEPRTAEEHVELTSKYWFNERKLDKAIHECKEALRIDPNCARARSNLGSLYLQQNRIEEAIVEFEEALRRGVPQAVVRHNTETWLKEAAAIRDARQKPIGDVREALREYIEELGGPCNRLPAVYEKLMEIGAAAVDALLSAMHTGNFVLSNRVFGLLGNIGDPRAVEPLSRTSNITEKEFRAMTGDKGATRTVSVSSMTVEVKVSDLLEEYRTRAREASEKIKQNSGPD